MPRPQGQTKHTADSTSYEDARGTGTDKARLLGVGGVKQSIIPEPLGRVCACAALQPYSHISTRNTFPGDLPFIPKTLAC